MTTPSPEFLTVPAVAKRLGMSCYLVRTEYERGILPAHKVSRFLRFTEDDIAVYRQRTAVDLGGRQSGLTDLSRRRRRNP
ncbi:MAG: helix-turn-helix domain-containing protein [Micrococcales bacterium]|nr:helix-turn-helix domain-containing protein [Micrococcales bacterium]